MGIKGLLQALNVKEKESHLSNFRKHKVAVDGYAWLHRAAFASMHEVVLGGTSNDYIKAVRYFMRRAVLLRSYDIDATFVFDGRGLPSKADTNAARRQRREVAKSQAEMLMKQGNKAAAFKMMGQAISIKFDMVLATLKQLKKESFKYLIAPYEADAQLGYMSQNNIIDAVVSEDSDLILYGCKKILFKMDETGYCQCCEFDCNLSCAGLLPGDIACEDALIILCAMAGCDYIEGIRGVGLKKGAKLVARGFRTAELMKEDDSSPLANRLSKVLDEVKLAGYTVASGYATDLRRALWTFKHQLVYDPRENKLTRRYPLPARSSLSEDLYSEIVDCLGPPLEDGVMVKICQGLLEPHSLQPTKLEEVVADKDTQKKENVNTGNTTLRGWLTTPAVDNELRDLGKRKRALTSHPSHRNKIIKLDVAERRGQEKPVVDISPTPSDEVSTATSSMAMSSLESFKCDNDSSEQTKDHLPKPRVGLGLLKKRNFDFSNIETVVDKYKYTI
eukprot:Blabericola_migrator_1__11541@NODE_68_length_15625_cov_137_110426_g61_i0_p5_GENE_NODE_68_length_15625_cov_137_110426_g61_i0NODE_68_length_15625_cov_137_110426_g61_i0_p5_ORF_typecomplete_len504_score102_91XPG_I/PF00867_18/1_4e20XPG_N/PF00752_17/1_6e20XPG_I_2/PF12813_7/0_0038DUF2258/PF10015_9/4_4e03DUF2258/PF10015_9/1_2e04DUF2258/PF10015_9/0_31Adeno_terminal/PF02459_15/0_16DNA_pol_lambd_f/PF10391_9/0_36_NODE_68_length_15625_cov_137_110426_g61_i01681679